MKLILKDNFFWYHSDLENRTLTFKKLECSGKFPIGTTRSYAFTLQLDFLETVCKTIAINYKIQTHFSLVI